MLLAIGYWLLAALMERKATPFSISCQKPKARSQKPTIKQLNNKQFNKYSYFCQKF